MGYTKVSNWPTILKHLHHTKRRKFELPRRRSSILVTLAIVGASLLVGGGLLFTYVIKQAEVRLPAIPGVNAPGHVYGIAAGSSLTELNDEDLDKHMAGIADSGASWVRLDFNWSIIQPDNASDYNWTQLDKIVAAAEKYHLYTLGILAYTPEWARASECKDSDKCPPADNKQFADFAAATAHRYKAHGLHFWEVWNEPNNPQFWQPGASPAAYAKLLQQTATALRKEDQKVYIITAGLSPQATTDTSYSPIAFLTAFYKTAAKDSFDAVADHPYTFPLSPKASADHAWNQMASAKSSLRQIMVANGDKDKKLWITEFGAPTGGPGPVATVSKPNLSQHPYVVDEALQSNILKDAIALYTSYDWTGPFFYYSYQDAGDTPDTNENFFGLIRFDGSKKPAYQVFQNATR